jgi:two-component system CheB/CheR fusion protein
MSKATSNPKKEKKQDFYVVGIGASAGGLDAIQALFDNIPANTGMAFVIVQHLSPTFKSVMDELLQKHTRMHVQHAKNNIRLKPNNIYLNPKEKNIIIEDGCIKYVDKTTELPLNLPIDFFFHSLGNNFEEKAIGIILSGTGTDGSRGISTIKGAGGTVIVQKPESAQFDGMPVTAINSGNAEFVATPDEMGLILDRITSCSFLSHTGNITKCEDEEGFSQILDILFRHSGIDFKLYKNTTLLRRIEKRIAIHQLSKFREYAEFLNKNDKEINLLLKDCLIGVTRYFRDIEAFESLKKNVLPNLFDVKKKKDFPVRIWVTACSTGEEAYTMAIIVDNYLKENNIHADFKVFATDIDKDSIQIASEGKYPVNYVADIPRAILDNYFIKSGNSFEIIKRIREKIVFSRHNILKDPPFIKIDLISCRNMLIYLLQKVQYKVIGTFQFGLNKGGFLFLGHSETLGESQKLFKTIDSQWRIYESIADYKELPSRLQTDLRLKDYDNTFNTFGYQKTNTSAKINNEKFFTESIANVFGPPCLFISANFEILFVNGDINEYIEFPRGVPKNNILDSLVDDKLKAMVRNGLRRTQNEDKKIVFKDISFTNKKNNGIVSLSFQKIELEPTKEKVVLISFEKKKKEEKKEDSIIYDQYKLDEFSKQRIEDLEAELKKIKQELQNTIEELESSNEELQASNEELQASNEELQSTNEELQSVNEELYTVNAEVQVKNKELIDLNDDVTNILDSTNIGILFMDTDLRIRKFTPALKLLYSLTQNDIGRPISNFASNFTDVVRKEFIADAKEVLKTGVTIEKEFKDDSDRYFLRKSAPFISGSNQINGVVISFVDITSIRDANKKIELANRNLQKSKFDLLQAQKIAHLGSWYLNIETNEVDWTEELYNMYGFDSTLPPPPYNEHAKLFTPKSWGDLTKSLENTTKTGEPYELELQTIKKDGSKGWMWVRGEAILDKQEKIIALWGAAQDITERKKNEEIIHDVIELNRQLINSSTLGVFACKESGQAVIANEAVAKISGASLETMLSLNYHNLPRWKENGIYDKVILALQTGQAQHLEINVLSSFDRNIWTNFYITTFVSGGEKHFLMMVEDITERKQLEIKQKELAEEIKSTLVRLEMATKAAGMGIWVLDIPANTLEWNNKMFELYGTPEESNLLFDFFRSRVHPDDIAMVEQKIQDHINGTGIFDPIFRIVLPNGELRFIEAIATIERDALGNALRMVGYNRDITERVTAEQSLLASEARFRNMFEKHTAVMLLIEPATGDIFDANDAAANFYGYPVTALKTLNISSINMLSAQDIETERLKALEHKRNYFVFPHQLSNGETRVVEVRSCPIQSADKTLLFSIINDITDRTNAELSLLESEERFRAIFENSPDAYLIMELDGGRISDCNKAAEIMLRGSRDQIIGKTPDVVSPPFQIDGRTSFESAAERIQESLRDGKHYFEWLHRRLDGTDFWAEVTISVVSIKKHQVLFVAWRDISEKKKILSEIENAQKILKQQTAELIQSEKMNAIGTLTAGVAHELNNPLMGILNYAGYCKENTKPDNKIYPVLTDLIEEAERSAEIVKNLLTFARKDEESGTFNTNINQGITNSLRLLNLKTKSKNLNLKFNNPSHEFMGNIKPSHLQQIIYNLVDNAIYAVEHTTSKEINIEIKDAGNFSIVEVRDTGTGIIAENLNFIFDPFYTTKPVGKGTGLGLSICKNMIEETGGNISCDSLPEKGTTFLVYIPKVTYNQN